MSKTATIIKREFLSRVKKKSFLVMTIVGPVLMAALIIVPVIVAQVSRSDYAVAIVDDTSFFHESFKDTQSISFTPVGVDVEQAINLMHEGRFDAVLHIPEFAFQAPSSLRLFSEKSINFNAKLLIENTLRHEFEGLKLAEAGIDPEVLKQIETRINIQAFRIKDGGELVTDHPEISMGLGFIGGFLIYIFIFLFGSQVLRGVLEEKTSRIVEIIVSSVRPFQLMMGKVVGVGLVGLTQFMIWVVLTFAIVGVFRFAAPDLFRFTATENVHITSSQILSAEEMEQQLQTIQQHNTVAGQLLEGLAAINFPVIIITFIFFFLGGYLLYAAFFAAIGSAVDNEADTQQFMLPVTIPLLLSIIMAQMVINDPSGSFAVWLSMIPLTSPVIMMVRIPFGVPYAEVALSAILLILGFIGTLWISARIYRTGILMYGKKVNYAELWKWIRHA
ncbi:MAG: ABC transporter permease [Bacteroidales bacterium]|nr:ABC transporter permease [Bacteroidales bacterium]